MLTPTVIANWKMNGSAELCHLFARELQVPEVVNVWIAPPSFHLALVSDTLSDAHENVKVGVQNVFYEMEGAFTGEISAVMANNEGAEFSLVGHSERRSLFGDDDEIVARKVVACAKVGLLPVICVGESLAEREAGSTESVVARQLDAVAKVDGFRNHVIVAYEPVWAIGTGVSALPEQAQEVHEFIRSWLVERKAEAAKEIPLLYGGSVKAANAASLIEQSDVDGFLVGGASLDVNEFGRICAIAENF